ncbi:MAG: glutaredoxin family protein, partial [Leptothrix sp. (in: b-proteobacteria)]
MFSHPPHPLPTLRAPVSKRGRGVGMGMVARSAALIGLLLGGTLPAVAQYKVVGPDGRVTFTDRPPITALDRPRGAASAASAPAAAAADGLEALPYALRQVVARYPVTLYTGPNCAPCDAARTLLRQRGVPHTERIAATSADVNELVRLEQTNEVPILRLGAQRQVGFQREDWTATLDAAGYPRQSQLPARYRQAAAAPLVPAVPIAAEVPLAGP